MQQQQQNHEEDELNAGKFWKYCAPVPSLVRSTTDRLRLLDIEHRQAVEALIETSTRTLPLDPKALAMEGKVSIFEENNKSNNNEDADNNIHQAAPSNSAAAAATSSSALPSNMISALQKQQQDELRTIARLEDAVVKTAEKKVEIARSCLREIQLLVERFRQDDDDDDDQDDGEEEFDEDDSSDYDEEESEEE